jgi:ABC-type Zn uptake system ZnuABC Zn-binding protein ZnuA
VPPRARAPAALALALALGSASPPVQAAQAGVAGPRPLVAATIQPLGLVATELAGDRAAVSVLVAPGASPHVFEPRPRDLERLRAASVVVCAGGGLDDWALRLLSAGGSAQPPVVATELPGMDPLPAPGGSGVDPHVWLDPVRVRDALAPALAAALARADPEAAPGYAARLAAFQASLERLDAELRAALAGRGRRYVAYHAAWRYFAQRYGLEEVGVVQAFAGEEPTPRELAALVAAARGAQVRGVLVEPQLASAVARALARELGVPLVPADPLGDPTDPARSTYAGLLRFDAAAFARALADAPR